MQKAMTGFVDIHTHILPGVDDGAADILEGMKLVRMAWEDGTRALFLTPHYRGSFKENTPAWLHEVFSMFRQSVAEELPEMELYLGSEAHYEAALPELLCEGKVMPLLNSQYVLLEFLSTSVRSQIVNGVSEVIRCGFTPVIAHAERYNAFRKDAALADTVLAMGALIQLNASSILGKHGYGIKQFCHRLLQQRKAHFIASDAHDCAQRPPLLQACWQRVSKKYTADYASALFRENAQAIIENRDL